MSKIKDWFWGFPKPFSEEARQEKIKQISEPEIEKNEVQKVDEKDKEITGKDVMYRVPDNMNSIIVQLRYKDGSYKNQYTLTNYLDIQPGEKIRIIIK